jgi:DinB family protein
MLSVLSNRWSEIGDKIVSLAKEVPAEGYAFRPSDDVRSFADQLRHVAFWNRYVEGVLAGAEPDGAGNELPAADFPGKPQILPELEASFAAVAAGIAKQNGKAPLDTLVGFIEHNGEHYGQLVVYCRLQGMVPPTSRA